MRFFLRVNNRDFTMKKPFGEGTKGLQSANWLPFYYEFRTFLSESTLNGLNSLLML